jgi:hypothetical protein
MWLEPRNEVTSRAPPRKNPRQSIAPSILNFQGNLNSSRILRPGNRAETTGEELAGATASRGTERNKWTAHIARTYVEDMAVKDIEKLCPKVHYGLLPEDPGFLAQREILFPRSESAGRGKGPGFVAKRQWICGCKCGGIPEWGRERIEMALVGLGHARNNVHARRSGKVASGK